MNSVIAVVKLGFNGNYDVYASLPSSLFSPYFPSSFPISFSFSLHFLKVLCTLLVVPSICDFGKSIWQAAWWGVATSDTPNATIVEHHVVAPIQIVTPIVFVVDMVCFNDVC